MSRREDMNEFYELLGELRERVGGYRRLHECTGRSGWPERGVYFFFESGEFREDQETLRVVRVGTHAVTATSQTTLWNRLHTHRGRSDLGGNHRGSIFRTRIGEALWRVKVQPNDATKTWGVRSSASGPVRLAEVPLEQQVSAYIRQMPFLWVSVPDAASRTSDRACLELNSIALLSNFERLGIDSPSANWLGLQSRERTIRESGLWNTNHVEKFHDPTFLGQIRAYVGGTIAPQTVS